MRVELRYLDGRVEQHDVDHVRQHIETIEIPPMDFTATTPPGRPLPDCPKRLFALDTRRGVERPMPVYNEVDRA